MKIHYPGCWSDETCKCQDFDNGEKMIEEYNIDYYNSHAENITIEITSLPITIEEAHPTR
jgi:hypothetical protein